MASRKVHNHIAKMLTGYSYDMIDNVNKITDEPVKYMGRYHREVRHSINPFRLDSLMVSRGDFKRELVRQIHIAVDETPIGKAIGELLEMQYNVRRRKK